MHALDGFHPVTRQWFTRRFPHGPPSLLECERFVVRGDVTVGAGIVVRGRVELDAPTPERIAGGAEIGD